MEMIRSRNAQSAVTAMLQTLYANGEQADDGNLVLDYPVLFTFEKPRERMLFWPGVRRNPAVELRQALESMAKAEEHMGAAAQAAIQGNENFLFSTPRVMIQCRLGYDGKMNMHAVIADSNPFQGAFGQFGLQLSILLELMAGTVKKHVGELTIQQQQLKLPAVVVGNLMKASLDQTPEDPYQHGMKPRKIDGPLGIQHLLETPEVTMGHRSKWARHVAGPVLLAGAAEDPETGLQLAQRIKGDDWKRSMIEWCEAVVQANAFRKAQEEAAGAE